MAIRDNLESINSEIRSCCKDFSRDEESVKLLAVSKTKPLEMLKEAYEWGQRDFGENRVQEGEDKVPNMPKDARFHLIGHLQSNKVAKACMYFDVIQSVDSLKIAKKINNKCGEIDKIMDIYLDINISGEDSKTGFSPGEEFITSVGEILEMKNLKLLGLMGIASHVEESETIKGDFIRLKELLESINSRYGLNLKELSMGMSGDYREAIECGSTMVRIGSSIFGSRGFR